jgi:anti-sigma factor RsiW
MDEHERTRKDLPALVTGSLPAADEETALAHLARCTACARAQEAWQRLVQGLQHLPESIPAPFRLARISALATARRAETVARQRNTQILVTLAVFSFLLFLATLPLLSALTDRLGGWLGLSPTLAFTVGLAVWWGSSLLAGLGLVPLLREHRADWKEKRT